MPIKFTAQCPFLLLPWQKNLLSCWQCQNFPFYAGMPAPEHQLGICKIFTWQQSARRKFKWSAHCKGKCASSKECSRAEVEVRMAIDRSQSLFRKRDWGGNHAEAGKIWEDQIFAMEAGLHRPKCTQMDESICQGFRNSCRNWFSLIFQEETSGDAQIPISQEISQEPEHSSGGRPLSVPFQEKGVIWRPCWGWKNMGGSNFCYGSGPLQTQMHPNGWEHMPRIQEQLTELIFVDFSGRGSWFSEGYLSVWRI